MRVGIGLPATIPGVRGATVLDWARSAENGGFSTLAVLDRLAYNNYEPLTTLAAAAAVTTNIRLATTILIEPLRNSPALLAKQLATVDQLSAGRLTVGIAPGGREDDYTAADADYHRRGRQLDADLIQIERTWAQQAIHGAAPVGPPPVQARPTLLFGGTTHATYQRVARHGDGWIFSGGNPAMLAQCLEPLHRAWNDAGRSGQPHVMSLAYFSLGPDGQRHAEQYLQPYYHWLGTDIARSISNGAATTPAMVRQHFDAFAAAGCDELVFAPCNPDPDQVPQLATAIH